MLVFLPVIPISDLKLRYGELPIKRAVPLALALTSVSNPKLQILDTLSKFSHDSDPEVAHNAILAMGLVGAGMSQNTHPFCDARADSSDMIFGVHVLSLVGLWALFQNVVSGNGCGFGFDFL